MKKKILLLGMCSLLLCGCGKIPTLSNGDEAVVTFKDGAISANDFYKEIKDSYGLNTLISMIDKYIFEREFDDKVSEAKKYAETYVKQMRTNFDKEEDFLKTLSVYGYQTVEAFQNSLYISYLQNEAIKTYVTDKITEDELKEYYEKSVYPNMTISHILITPNVTDKMSDEEKKKEENKAKEEINKIIGELNKAKKNKENINDVFTKLAKEYSKDDSTKNKGGDLGEINIDSLNSKYDELVKAAYKLKDGEYSTELITTESGYHVILKTKTGTKKSYDDSLSNMKEKITTEKLSNDKSLSVEAIKHYREKYEMNITDSEVKSQYGRYMNNLINQNK